MILGIAHTIPDVCPVLCSELIIPNKFYKRQCRRHGVVKAFIRRPQIKAARFRERCVARVISPRLAVAGGYLIGTV